MTNHLVKPPLDRNNWKSWSAVAAARLVSYLPASVLGQVAEAVGRVSPRLLKSRYKVALKNIQVCFPELEASSQETLAKSAVTENLYGMLASTKVWFGKTGFLDGNLIVEGEEHLKNAIAMGRGVILIGGHYSILDVAAPLLVQVCQYGYMYRPNDDPVIDWMITAGRDQYTHKAFSKRETREAMAYIQNGGVLWYACDQDLGRYCDLFVPFFGVQAGCVSMPSKVARRTGAVAVCLAQHRLAAGKYRLTFSEVNETFGQDDYQDALWWNGFLETQIRRHPGQYLWLHKRFKTRPPGEDNIY